MSRFPLHVPLLFSLIASSIASSAAAQPRATNDTPLHVPTNRFEFVVSSRGTAAAKPLAVHNGGAARLTDVRLARVTYADSSHRGWLAAAPRQSAVAPDELATIGTLCVDASGLPAGVYRATAAVVAREVREPVAITITLTVPDAAATTRPSNARRSAATCAPAARE